MKTENKITPASVGFSLVVCSGHRGAVLDNWPCTEWTVQVMHKGKPVWTGEWRAGVGHVKPYDYEYFNKFRFGPQAVQLTESEKAMSHAWARNPGAKFDNQQDHANLAAKLAQRQRATPSLDSVMGSLLMDGSAFFDGCQFEDWAGEYGYSADSIKAKETFEACDKIGRALSRAVSRDELTGLREWASEQ